MQVALHVTMRRHGAKASNRVSVSGGVSGVDVSQEAVALDAADGVDLVKPSSTPGNVGKANKQRAGRPGEKKPSVAKASTREMCSSAVHGFKRWLIHAVFAALLLGRNHIFVQMEVQMSMIRVSEACGRVYSRQASMQVALHVTMRQNGAKASNRVSVSGGVSGVDVSQEAVALDAADGGLFRWTGRSQLQRHT
jgi:hypothetical protein